MCDLRRARWGWLAWGLPLALALCVALPGNGARRPLETHEVYVARTAEEMLRSGAYLRPTFNGDLRLEKPPLSYWLTIASHQVVSRGGSDRVTEFEARLPSVLGALGVVLAIYFLGRVVSGDPRVGTVAATLVGTSAGFASYAHNARPEMVYALGCVVEVLGFMALQRRRAENRATFGAALLAWGGFTVALLAKGPLLPTFLLLGLMVGWLLERPRVRLLRVLRLEVGLLVIVPVALVVFAGLVRAEPRALSFWWNQMFHHGGGRSLAWYLPLQGYYFIATLPLLLPWLAPLPGAARDAWRAERPFVRPLAFAVIVPAILLSFSPTQRAYYFLPAVPLVFVALAMVAVRWFDAARSEERARQRLQRILLAHFVLLASLGVGAIFIVGRDEDSRALLVTAIVVFSGALAAGAVWLLRPRTPSGLVAASAVLAACVAQGLAAAGWSRAGWGSDRYERAAFAREVAAAVPREAPVVSIGPSVELLVYYGDRYVKRVTREELPAVFAREPRTHLLALRKDLAQLGVAVGEPIVADGSDDDSSVLVALAGDSTSSK